MTIYNEVVLRLEALGYTVAGNDEFSVTHAINLSKDIITAKINRDVIPDGLYLTHVNMAAGLFLQELKSLGKLTSLEGAEIIDFSAPVKTVKEGDTSVTFASASDGALTPEARFDRLVDSLINPPSSIFTRFRRLLW